jgi:hypothetical protein
MSKHILFNLHSVVQMPLTYNFKAIKSINSFPERPTSTNPQLSDSNKNMVVSPDGCFIPRQTGRLTVGRNIRLTQSQTQSQSQSHSSECS